MMQLLLLLLCVLSVSAAVQHEDLSIKGCSDSEEGAAYALDGELMWYANFQRQVAVEPQPDFVEHMNYASDAYQTAAASILICRRNLDIVRNATRDLPLETDIPSSILLYPKEEVVLDHPNVLVCFISGFYPAPVSVSWRKNGQPVGEGSDLSVPLPNKDGTFRQTSTLPFTPLQGNIYSCSVKHLDLMQTRIWDVAWTQPSLGPSIFCGVGLTVGLLGVAAGTFFLVKGNECR